MAVKYYNIKCKKIITKYLKDWSLKVPQNEPSVVEGCGSLNGPHPLPRDLLQTVMFYQCKYRVYET